MTLTNQELSPRNMSRHDLEIWAELLEEEFGRLQQMLADELPEGRIPDGYRVCSDWWAEQVRELETARRDLGALHAEQDRIRHRNRQEFQERDKDILRLQATIVRLAVSVFGPSEKEMP